jgi:ABC-type bacteriocin/lantibiotic exporter with double-glycine peptidase domain
MPQTTITAQREAHHSLAEELWAWRAETLWIVAGIVLLLAFGDALVLLVLAFAIVAITTAWWTYRKVAARTERVARNDAQLASVSQLRPAFASQRDLKKTSAHAPWRGPSAA